MLAKKIFFQYFREYREKDSWTVFLFRSKSLKMSWKTEKGKNRNQTARNLFIHLFVLGPAYLFDACPLPCASPTTMLQHLSWDAVPHVGPFWTTTLPEKGTREVLYHDSLAAKGEPRCHLSVLLLSWRFSWRGL